MRSGKKAVVRPIDLPPGRRVLVVSDIHGNLPFLKGVLAKANFSKEDILIVLGDLLERHESSLDTLRYVMELSRTHTVYTILGNCDNVVLDFVDRGGDETNEFFHDRWLKMGEKSAVVKMAHMAGVSIENMDDYPAAREAIAQQFKPEMDFLRSLPHIYINDDYLFVHGGVPREDRLEELEAFGVMKNDDFRGQGHDFQRWVIVGHWPVTLYRADIPSAKPLVDRERHIVSIDGGCVLKWDGQLNALILPEKPEGEFSYVSYDGFPEMTALDPQEANTDPINIRFGHSKLEVLERGEELSACRHIETGRELEVLTEYLWERDGETYCEDSTDYLLPVEPGDRLSIVRQISDRALCKNDGATGWYFGRLEP